MSNTYDFGWGLQDVLGSPIYNILETVSGLPGVRDTQFSNWLADAPLFQGVRNFQSQQPLGADIAEVASYLVPYAGWAGLTSRVGARGLAGLTAKGAVSAASAFPRNPGLAFAVGETVRFAPLSAALNTFDYAGGQQTLGEAFAGFGLDAALNAGVSLGGHALSPVVQRYVPALSGAWDAVFQPGPELSRLYGFSDNVRRAAERTSRSVPVQEATSPLLEPQQRAALLWDLIAETEAGAHPEVDVDLLRGQYDVERRAILQQTLDPVEAPFRWERDSKVPTDIRRTTEHLLRHGPSASGNRVRIPVTGTGTNIDNPDVLAGQLELPDGWVHDTQLPGLTQATFESATPLRQHIGLEGEQRNGFRRLERLTPTGQSQIWSLRQEQDGGWLATTEVPVFGSDVHRMTGRGRFDSTKRLDPGEPARVFFSFKTTNPSRFFPEMRIDTDMPDPGVALSFDDRIPRGQSEFLDKAMQFRDIYLSKETIRAAYEGRLSGKGARQRITQEMLAGPTMGKEIARLFETYTAPTDQQLRSSPEGRSILGLYQALFDAADGRKSRILHGMASIPEDKNPITALFSAPNMDDANALVTQLRRTLQEDPEALEIIRKFDKVGGVEVESIAETPAGKWLELALKVNDQEIETINKAIEALRAAGATDARTIPIRRNHFGISRRWDGSNFYPIYREGAAEPVAVVAGGSQSHAEKKADEWIAAEFARNPSHRLRKGQPFIAGEGDEVPGFIRLSSLSPGLLEPRAGIRGYEHEFEPYKHVDDFITELEDNYTRRWRYAASVVGDALTGGKLNQLLARDPHAYDIVRTRISQLKGQPGPLEQRLNQIVDKVAAKYVGTNSLSKASDATNELNFHLLHGVGNIATPLLNITSVLQTQLPEAVNFLTSDPGVLRGMGYMFPVFGPDGLPRSGFNYAVDSIGLAWKGVRKAINPGEDFDVFQELFNRKEMGTGLANEYTGQDRTIALRASEGIRGPEDYVFWAKRVSSYLMQRSEQVSRTVAVGMSLEAMGQFEKINGVKFTFEQKVANALKFVRRTNYGYFTADRPQMFTTPLGALFGNQKTWMTNYLFIMAEYFGLGMQKQNWAPLLMTLGTTTALGGAFAVPLLGAGIDAFTEAFADQPGMEFIYEQMGEGGNAISFGLPALLGVSISGNVSAPGSNLAHDATFFQSIVGLERASQMGRALGRAWDDQMVLGMNPWQDPLFRRQAAQAFAPRSLYRGFEALLSDQITSAATGYPVVKGLGIGARVLRGLGFQDVDVALQYRAYDDLMRDRDEMRRQVSLFGEAYAMASMANDRQRMLALLQQASVRGLDISRVMQSSQIRMRNAGKDMFGRNISPELQEQYRSALASTEGDL